MSSSNPVRCNRHCNTLASGDEVNGWLVLNKFRYSLRMTNDDLEGDDGEAIFLRAWVCGGCCFCLFLISIYEPTDSTTIWIIWTGSTDKRLYVPSLNQHYSTTVQHFWSPTFISIFMIHSLPLVAVSFAARFSWQFSDIASSCLLPPDDTDFQPHCCRWGHSGSLDQCR